MAAAFPKAFKRAPSGIKVTQMKRILVTLLVLLSTIALTQFSPNISIPQAYAINPLTSVTLSLSAGPTAEANNTVAAGAYQTILVKVVTSPTTLEKDAQLNITVNGNFIVCPSTLNGLFTDNATSTGMYSCHYQIENLANATFPYPNAASTYTFMATARITGTPGGPFALNSGTTILIVGPNVVQIPLVAGWNLISLPVVPANTGIATVLASQAAGANLTIVWSYQSGAWKSATLNSITHVFSGLLNTMQDGRGYWIYMTKADNLFVLGAVFAPPPALPPSYSLSIGWNLIGFKPQPTVDLPPSTTTVSVDTYLQSINTFYDTNNVWVYSNSGGTWTRATGSTPLTPGTALWIYMLAAGKTLYP